MPLPPPVGQPIPLYRTAPGVYGPTSQRQLTGRVAPPFVQTNPARLLGGIGSTLPPTPGYWSGARTRTRFFRSMQNAGVGQAMVLNTLVGVSSTIGGTIRESANWGTKTGYQEDYIGGAVYGFNRGVASNIGNIVGDIVGTVAGAAVGHPIIGGIAGSFIGAEIGDIFGKRNAYEKGRMASYKVAGQLAKHKVQFGRGFRDTEEAYTMRQMAVQEMAGSLLNARQYLGNEASFMHR